MQTSSKSTHPLTTPPPQTKPPLPLSSIPSPTRALSVLLEVAYRRALRAALRLALAGGLPSAILQDELYVQLLHTTPDPAIRTEARAGEALWFTELRGVRERFRRELEVVLEFARGALWDGEELAGLWGELRWAGFWE